MARPAPQSPGRTRWLVLAGASLAFAAAAFAALIAIGQAVLFASVLPAALRESKGAGELALQVAFFAVVLWLDAQVVLDVRRRLAAP